MKRSALVNALLLVLAATFLAQVAWGQIPQTLSYQGVLSSVDGKEVSDGIYNLTLRLYSTPTEGMPLWTETKQISVFNGMFNAILGSRNPLGLPFDKAYWLGITIGDGTEIKPRIELTASAYSLNARSIADSAVTGVKIADDQVVRSINSLKDHIKLIAGENVVVEQKGDSLIISARNVSNGNDDIMAGSTTTPSVAKSSSASDLVVRNLEVEGSIRSSGQKVNKTILFHNTNESGAPSGEGFRLRYDNNFFGSDKDALIIEKTDGNDKLPNGGIAFVNAGQGGRTEAGLVIRGDSRVGIRTDYPRADLHINGQNDELLIVEHDKNKIGLRIGIDEDRPNLVRIQPHMGDGIVMASVDNSIGLFVRASDGNVGIGNTNPDHALVVGPQSSGRHLVVNDIPTARWGFATGNYNMAIQNDGSGSWETRMQIAKNGNVGIGMMEPLARLHIGTMGLADNNTSLAFRMGGEGQFVIDSRGVVGGRMTVLSNGNIGIGTTSPDSKLHLSGGDLHLNGSASIYFQSGPSDPNYFIQSYPVPGSAAIRVKGYGGVNISTSNGDVLNVVGENVGIGTATPSTRLDIAGRTKTCVLEITGGCDLAEPFKISERQPIPTGALVIIDDDPAQSGTGQLKLSHQAYDKRVAGVVSGAGGINPGLTLTQEGVMEGGQNVALSGRVYALTTAANGPIKPGDLLTTSDVPGHAMKATDVARSHGTVIGKALSSLEKGGGLVLVLVNLQ